MKSRKFVAIFFLLLSFGLISNSGIRAADIVEGKDYTVLANPQPIQDSNKIEVLEFFWYGCPHCYSLHPHLKTWLMTAPGHVDFRYVPAIFRPTWVSGAKIFYTLEAMGMTHALHDKIYDALHRDKIDLNDETALFDWIEKQGVDRKKFESTYNSFGVQNQVTRSTQMSRQYQLTGVPALVINGKYVTSGKMGGTPQDTIKTLDALIEKAQKEK
jgi:thiol:disulfide interchange protein DsbA